MSDNRIMSDIRIYHNPRCSKSRETLALLQEQGIEPTVVEYLKDTPTANELAELLQKLGVQARPLIRSKEDEYKTLGLDNPELSEAQLINAMVDHPKLIERPLVVAATQARIASPRSLVSPLRRSAHPIRSLCYPAAS